MPPQELCAQARDQIIYAKRMLSQTPAHGQTIVLAFDLTDEPSRQFAAVTFLPDDWQAIRESKAPTAAFAKPIALLRNWLKRHLPDDAELQKISDPKPTQMLALAFAGGDYALVDMATVAEIK